MLIQLQIILYGSISGLKVIETSLVTRPYLGKAPSHDNGIDMNGLIEYGK